MLTRVVSVILILPMAVLELGCCCTIRNSSQIPCEDLTTYETVTGVKLNSGESIWFDRYGGEYVADRHIIIGTTDAGEFVEISVDHIETVNLGHRKIHHERYFKSEPVAAVVLKSGDVIQFDHEGGVYSVQERLITGTTEGGEHVEVNLDDVESIEVKRVSTGWSLLATLTVYVVIPVAIVIILVSQVEWGDGFFGSGG